MAEPIGFLPLQGQSRADRIRANEAENPIRMDPLGMDRRWSRYFRCEQGKKKQAARLPPSEVSSVPPRSAALQRGRASAVVLAQKRKREKSSTKQ
eukprot:1163380-Prorocentrum_minimum.AAC.1